MDRADKKRAQPDSTARTHVTPNPSPAQSVPVDFRALRATDIPRLQRSIGNQATGRLLAQSRPGSPMPTIQRLKLEQVYGLVDPVLGEYSDANIGQDALEAIAEAIAEATEAWETQEGAITAERIDFIKRVLGKYVEQMEFEGLEVPTTADGWLELLRPHMVDELAGERKFEDAQLDRIEKGESARQQPQGPVDEDRAQFLLNAKLMANTGPEEIAGLGKMWDLGDDRQRERILSVMGGESDLRRMSSLEHFLEQVSPIHVGYVTVAKWFKFWAQGVVYQDQATSWAEFMTAKVEGGDDEKEPKIIDSYDAETRAQFQLTPRGQHVFKASDEPLVGDNIYVLSKDDVWYGGSKDGPVHHSSFLQGAPVQCAGHLYTDNAGKLLSIDNNSGHYTPSGADLERAMKVLDRQMNTSDVKTRDVSETG